MPIFIATVGPDDILIWMSRNDTKVGHVRPDDQTDIVVFWTRVRKRVVHADPIVGNHSGSEVLPYCSVSTIGLYVWVVGVEKIRIRIRPSDEIRR